MRVNRGERGLLPHDLGILEIIPIQAWLSYRGADRTQPEVFGAPIRQCGQSVVARIQPYTV